MQYAIHIAEPIDEDWPAWFGPAQVTVDRSGAGLIIIELIDAAALNGLLAYAAALNLTLLCVQLLPPDEPPPTSST